MTSKPPADQAPAVLLDRDFTGDGTGALFVDSPEPGTVAGQPFGTEGFRDGTLDAELGLLEGADEDRYGLFLRQGAAEHYVACTVSAAGELAFGLVNGGPPLVIASGPLGPEVPFARGVGVTNRLTIVSCGPVAAVIVNGAVVVGVAIPEEYGSGPAGALLAHTSASPRARVGVRWAQVRALLPDQVPQVQR
jgi:hypothetical protein